MQTSPLSPLDRARRKAYRRLLPLLFLCYLIAYVDRTNVSLAALTMHYDLPAFTKDVIGTGAGVFFLGYFLLEIPGTLIVEKWSARKWICRIMITWGIIAALTAWVKTEYQFYSMRFLLGLAEAGFFPGVIVYLTHWFPRHDRARALAWFFVATPVAQIVSPKISYLFLRIGTGEITKISWDNPQFWGTWNGLPTPFLTNVRAMEMVAYPQWMGLNGWQWVYIAWGIPAVVLGFAVFFFLTDRPHQAKWLTTEEREALESELAREKAEHRVGHHLNWFSALKEPKVLCLAAAYFFIVTGNYALEIFLPSIFQEWYNLNLNKVTWLVMLPPLGALVGQLIVGWSSDRTKERRLHAALPIYAAVIALIAILFSKDQFWLTVSLFVVVAMGLKAYLPAFWSLPSLFLVEAAAASSIGFINSVGNLGGFVGPKILGWLHKETNSFIPGLIYLCFSMAVSATILILLGLGRRESPANPADPAHPGPLPDEDLLADEVVDPA